MATAVPDPDRLGGIAWLERTRGALTRAERRHLLGALARAQVANVAGRVRLARGHRPVALACLEGTALDPPDSALAREAEAACAQQPPVLVAHSYRTWALGQALALVDGVTVDRELLYCACLLHDTGLATVVAGEDFTLRSARRATEVCQGAGLGAGTTRRVADAIAAHATPGVSVEADGALATYLQAGALADLGGLRLWDLPAATVEAQLARHPRADLATDICSRIRAEARAVPGGRFALASRWGLRLAIRLAPFDQEAARGPSARRANRQT